MSAKPWDREKRKGDNFESCLRKDLRWKAEETPEDPKQFWQESVILKASSSELQWTSEETDAVPFILT